MHISRWRAHILKAATCAVTLLASSCFTGIEGTPRIIPRGKDAASAPTPEREMALRIAPQPLSQWRAGKVLRITDQAAERALTMPSGMRIEDVDISYLGSRPAVSLTGDSLVELSFATAAGDTLAYRTRPAERVLVPYAADYDVAALADSLLRGRTLYIVTPMWYTVEGKAPVRESLRHVAVRVDSVVLGTDIFPACVVFSPADVSGQYSVYMSAYDGSRPFDALFSFTNPRERYPAITDAMWRLIVRSQVALGMSRDECRLAWGAPAVIRQLPTTAGMVEEWSYDDGRFLIFEDAQLARYRQ